MDLELAYLFWGIAFLTGWYASFECAQTIAWTIPQFDTTGICAHAAVSAPSPLLFQRKIGSRTQCGGLCALSSHCSWPRKGTRINERFASNAPFPKAKKTPAGAAVVYLSCTHAAGHSRVTKRALVSKRFASACSIFKLQTAKKPKLSNLSGQSPTLNWASMRQTWAGLMSGAARTCIAVLSVLSCFRN